MSFLTRFPPAFIAINLDNSFITKRKQGKLESALAGYHPRTPYFRATSKQLQEATDSREFPADERFAREGTANLTTWRIIKLFYQFMNPNTTAPMEKEASPFKWDKAVDGLGRFSSMDKEHCQMGYSYIIYLSENLRLQATNIEDNDPDDDLTISISKSSNANPSQSVEYWTLSHNILRAHNQHGAYPSKGRGRSGVRRRRRRVPYQRGRSELH